MSPGILIVEDVVEGDTWVGVPEFDITFEDALPTTTLVSVVMDFLGKNGVVLDSLSTTNGRITILDLATWNIRLEKTKLKLTRGIHPFGIKYFDSAQSEETIVEGRLKVTRVRVKSKP